VTATSPPTLYGNIFYSTEAALDVKITQILRVVDEIQSHSKPVIEHCYREFLLQNHDADEREYPDPADRIREVLIHGNYLSQRDIDICLGLDLGTFATRPEYENMRELHDPLVATYSGEGTTRSPHIETPASLGGNWGYPGVHGWVNLGKDG
jgi:hypothetical protein